VDCIFSEVLKLFGSGWQQFAGLKWKKKHDEESEKRLESRLNRFETVENIEKVVGTLKKL
jgi:hypothetical protein